MVWQIIRAAALTGTEIDVVQFAFAPDTVTLATLSDLEQLRLALYRSEPLRTARNSFDAPGERRCFAVPILTGKTKYRGEARRLALVVNRRSCQKLLCRIMATRFFKWDIFGRLV